MIKFIRQLGLIYQIGIVVLIGLAISFVLSTQLLSSEKSKSLGSLSASGALQRVISVAQILSQTPQDLHSSIIGASSSQDLSLSLTPMPRVTASQSNLKADSQWYAALSAAGMDVAYIRLLQQNRPIISMSEMHDAMMSSDGMMGNMSRKQRQALHMGYVATIEGSVQLNDQTWINFSSGIEEQSTHWSSGVLLALASVLLITLLLSLWMIQRALAPVKQLGQAARRFALQRKVTPLSEHCPSDLYPAIAAFNQMQVDLADYIEERTRLLAAISHDLRTPLTSLRLRLEFLEDGDDKQQMLASIAVMEKMLKATMSFAKEDSQAEPRQITHIHILLQTIVDEYADKGIHIDYQPQTLSANVPPLTIRRMLENLINNSVQYAGPDSTITLQADKRRQRLELTVADTGIGIDAAKFGEVLKPFTRLDAARDTAGSNIGLGLSITQALAKNCGGHLTLSSNQPHGLVCRVTIALE